MRLRKEVKDMDVDLHKAFKIVSRDIANLIDESLETNRRIGTLNKKLKSMKKNEKRFYTVGPLTGNTYTTLNGRVHAIAEHLGLTFSVKEKEVVNAKVSAVKATKKGAK